MARLLEWFSDELAVVGWNPLTGPRTQGGSSTESATGWVQSVASPFGLWRWQLNIRAMKGPLFRQYRMMATALHGGANAVRVPFFDPDMMTWAESGVDTTAEATRAGVAWTTLKSFHKAGANCQDDRPWASVLTAAALGDTEIRLANEYWGRNLQGGEWIGFTPEHFGMYLITKRIDAVGRYNIWPPLRKALATSDDATLTPIMAMRLEGEAGATANRGLALAEGNTLTLVEVVDPDVRTYFAD